MHCVAPKVIGSDASAAMGSRTTANRASTVAEQTDLVRDAARLEKFVLFM